MKSRRHRSSLLFGRKRSNNILSPAVISAAFQDDIPYSPTYSPTYTPTYTPTTTIPVTPTTTEPVTFENSQDQSIVKGRRSPVAVADGTETDCSPLLDNITNCANANEDEDKFNIDNGSELGSDKVFENDNEYMKAEKHRQDSTDNDKSDATDSEMAHGNDKYGDKDGKIIEFSAADTDFKIDANNEITIATSKNENSDLRMSLVICKAVFDRSEGSNETDIATPANKDDNDDNNNDNDNDNANNVNNDNNDNDIDGNGEPTEEVFQISPLPERRRTFRDRFMRKSMGRVSHSKVPSSQRRSVLSAVCGLSSPSAVADGNGGNDLQTRRSPRLRLWPTASSRSGDDGSVGEKSNENGEGGVGGGYDYGDQEESQQSMTLDISSPFYFFRATDSVDKTRRGNDNSGGGGCDGDNDTKINNDNNIATCRTSMLRQLSRRVTTSNKDDIGTSKKDNRNKPERGWVQGALNSVRNRGGPDTSWKAGVYEFECDGQTALHEVRWLLERDYFGVVLTERFTEVRMRVPLTVSGKLTLIKIVVAVEHKADGGSRISLKRGFGDAFSVRHDDFDWFCFDVYRRLVKTRDVVRPHYC